VTDEVLAGLLGLGAGVLSAMFGVGGGIVFVPTLILLDLSTHEAVATSLIAMVPVVLMGAWRQTGYGNVRWRDAVVVGVASVPTAKVGEIIASSLSDDVLRRGFALVMLATAIQLALRAWRTPAPESGEAVADRPASSA
jgi:uncharacterized membrane protein YfcA